MIVLEALFSLKSKFKTLETRKINKFFFSLFCKYFSVLSLYLPYLVIGKHFEFSNFFADPYTLLELNITNLVLDKLFFNLLQIMISELHLLLTFLSNEQFIM